MNDGGPQLRRQDAPAGNDQRPPFDRRVHLLHCDAGQRDEDQHFVIGFEDIDRRLPGRGRFVGRS